MSPIAGGIAERIDAVRKRWSAAHLILDLGSLAGADANTAEHLMDRAYEAVSSAAEWKTLTILAAAFPLSLVRIRKDDMGLIDRNEFIAWLNRRHAGKYSRMPTFGDYVVQNSDTVEPADPTKPINPYAAIRYTLERTWLVVKGKVISEHGGAQFIDLAKRLTNDARFIKRPPHCEGCRRVLETAEDYEAVLDPRGWRRWGTVHHITLTIEQVSALHDV